MTKQIHKTIEITLPKSGLPKEGLYYKPIHISPIDIDKILKEVYDRHKDQQKIKHDE